MMLGLPGNCTINAAAKEIMHYLLKGWYECILHMSMHAYAKPRITDSFLNLSFFQTVPNMPVSLKQSQNTLIDQIQYDS